MENFNKTQQSSPARSVAPQNGSYRNLDTTKMPKEIVEAMINNLLKHIGYLESELKIHEEGYVEDRETIENLKKQLARVRRIGAM